MVPNSVADAVASAYLDEAPDDGRREQRATMIRYGVEGPDGHVWATPADRRPSALVERLGQQYVLSTLAKSAGSGPRLLLDEDKAAGRPTRLWSTVLRLSSEGGDHTGSRWTPTAVGAVMMLRDGRLGLRADEGRGSADDAVRALLEQQAGSTRGRGPADDLAASLA